MREGRNYRECTQRILYMCLPLVDFDVFSLYDITAFSKFRGLGADPSKKTINKHRDYLFSSYSNASSQSCQMSKSRPSYRWGSLSLIRPASDPLTGFLLL